MLALKEPDARIIEPTIPDPIIGGKAWVCEASGIYLLQRGPGALRFVACTHTGSAYVRLWDSLDYNHGNMRQMFPLAPTILGAWNPDAGFNDGLLCEVIGTPAPALILVWIGWKKPQRD